MKVFMVIREGVYRHEVLGVFSDLDKAKEVAYTACESEEDDYHTYDIYKGTVDQEVEDLIREGFYRRYDFQRDKDGIVRECIKLETPEIEYN